jgi:hypothetical protein
MSLWRSTSSTLRPHAPAETGPVSTRISSPPARPRGARREGTTSRVQLAKYFETFTDRRQTEYAGADHDTERKEQNHLGDQPPRQEAGEERCYHGADGDPEQ